MSWKHYRWYVLGVLLCVYTCNMIDRTSLFILSEQIKSEFHLSDGEIGVLLGIAYSLPAAIFAIPLGLLSDRVSKVSLLSVLVAIWSLLTALCGKAHSYLAILLARAGVGASEVGGIPCSLSIASEYFPPTQRATAFGVIHLGPPIGQLLGFVIASHVASTHGWRVAFLVIGLPGVILSLLLALTVVDPMCNRFGASSEEKHDRRMLRCLKRIFETKTVLHIGAMLAIGTFAASGVNSWAATFLMRVHGFDLKTAGYALGASALLGSVGAVTGGWLADRTSFRKIPGHLFIPATVLAVGTVVDLCLITVPWPSMAVLMLMVAFMLGSAWSSSLFALAMEHVAPDMRGSTTSVLMVMINLLGAGLGPVTVGVISQTLAPWGSVIALQLALAVVATSRVFALFHIKAICSRISSDRSIEPSLAASRG